MTLAHLRRGSGEPLVLVHGTGSQRQMWDPVLERLADRRDVIAVDLPGHGETGSTGEASVSPERYADAVEGLMDELGLRSAHIAGNSLGGGIALVLGARGRALSVTALSPIGFWTPREAAFCRASIRFAAASAAALDPLAPLILANPVGRTLTSAQLVARPWRLTPAESIGGTRNLARSRAAVHAATEGYRHWRFVPAGHLPCPVTIAWAQRDRLLLPRQADRARRAIPGGDHVVLHGCGHVPTWDDPDQVAAVLLEGSAPAP
jgi:pimeloyl-ACP methyl ester carboxylesterase